MRRIYGVVERQFQKYYFDAARRKGRTGEQMLGLLESRLDNVVHRLGFAFTRSQARQLVRHGHMLVNGKRVDIPSVILRPGDKVEVRQKSREIKEVVASLAQVDKRPQLSWLELDKANFVGHVQGRAGPRRDERAGHPRAVRRRVLLTLRRAICTPIEVITRAGDGRRRRAGSKARRDHRVNPG